MDPNSSIDANRKNSSVDIEGGPEKVSEISAEKKILNPSSFLDPTTINIANNSMATDVVTVKAKMVEGTEDTNAVRTTDNLTDTTEVRKKNTPNTEDPAVEGREEQEMKPCNEEFKEATITNKIVKKLPASTDIIDATNTAPTQTVLSTSNKKEVNKSPHNKVVAPPSPQLPRKEKRNKISNDNAAKAPSKTNCHEEISINRRSVLILSLPIDSLHGIASFLTPVEWTSFGQCNKGTNKICREIFRRVRMHGFRCATEVITAWVSLYFVSFTAEMDATDLVFPLLTYVSSTLNASRSPLTVDD